MLGLTRYHLVPRLAEHLRNAGRVTLKAKAAAARANGAKGGRPRKRTA